MKDFLNKTKDSFIKLFKKAWKGEEKINNIFLWWGGIAYVVTYFLLRPIIKLNDFIIIDSIISTIIVFYFTLHIILIKKNSPKKPKLTAAQKKKEKEERKKDRGKRIMRKLLLKEPLTKWRPSLVLGAVDILIITTYIGYII